MLGEYLQEAFLNHLLGKVNYGFETDDIYIALHSATPGNDGSNEITEENAYDRVQVIAANWNAWAAGTSDNGAAITFPQAAGGDWNGGVSIPYVGLWNHPDPSNGDFFFVLTITGGVIITEDDQLILDAGDCNLSLDD